MTSRFPQQNDLRENSRIHNLRENDAIDFP